METGSTVICSTLFLRTHGRVFWECRYFWSLLFDLYISSALVQTEVDMSGQFLKKFWKCIYVSLLWSENVSVLSTCDLIWVYLNTWSVADRPAVSTAVINQSTLFNLLCKYCCKKFFNINVPGGKITVPMNLQKQSTNHRIESPMTRSQWRDRVYQTTHIFVSIWVFCNKCNMF